MKILKILSLLSFIFILSACGGGGGVGDTPAASTNTFQLKAAYINYFNDLRSLPFKVSGSMSGVNVTGSGTLTQSNISNGTFEGITVLQKVVTITGTLLAANGQSAPLASTTTSYADSNYVPRGSSGAEYSVITSDINLPLTAKINDTAIWYTAKRYTSSSKTTLLGTRVFSFALQPDTASTALLKIIESEYNTSGTQTGSYITSYRMTPSGGLTRLLETGVNQTSSLTITFYSLSDK